MLLKRLSSLILAAMLALFSFVPAFASDEDLSANYIAAASIYSSSISTIISSTNRQTEIVKQLDRASTFQATDRRALLSADGYAVPAGAPAAMLENREALADMFAADGYTFTDYLKTLTIRIPQNYGMDYGTFNIARSTLQAAREAGFTDVVFQNDLFAVRLSMVSYLPQVPTSVTTLKYFVGETRTGVPQGALDIAKSMNILVFREYRDGVLVTDSDYNKNAVAIIADTAFYHVAGKQPSMNRFFKYDEVTETASSVAGYLYSGLTKTASFAVEDGNYFLFLLPNQTTAPTYTFSSTGYGLYNVQMSDNTFTADLFFENTCAAGSGVVYLALYNESGLLSQIKACDVTLALNKVSVSFELDDMDVKNFDMFIWRSAETIRPLFEKISGTL